MNDFNNKPKMNVDLWRKLNVACANSLIEFGVPV